MSRLLDAMVGLAIAARHTVRMTPAASARMRENTYPHHSFHRRSFKESSASMVDTCPLVGMVSGAGEYTARVAATARTAPTHIARMT